MINCIFCNITQELIVNIPAATITTATTTTTANKH
jgi:hypothetical protein